MESDGSISGGRSAALSVVIPTYNRADVLERCLRALSRQTVGTDAFDVLVVDDGSTDHTAAVATSGAFSGLSVRYMRQENAGPSVARNRALRATDAELVLIINDDTIAVPGCIEAHLRQHAAHPALGSSVLGRVTIAQQLPHSVFAPLHLDATFSGFEGKSELDWRGFITCNLSVKRQFLLEHGLFAEGLFPHEDLELGERLSHAGLRIHYAPEALGYHFHALEERDFFRAAERDGAALWRWYRMSPHLSELLFTLGLQGDAPLRMRKRQRLAQRVITALGLSRLAGLARLAATVNEPLARSVYLRLYQETRRRAIAAARAADPISTP